MTEDVTPEALGYEAGNHIYHAHSSVSRSLSLRHADAEKHPASAALISPAVDYTPINGRVEVFSGTAVKAPEFMRIYVIGKTSKWRVHGYRRDGRPSVGGVT
jgi:hypothetical protein